MKKILSTAVFVLAATLISAASTPLWLRDVKISPDGEKILFCYKGDIFVVASEGGAAQRLTSLPSYEQTPFWSPDGSTIAFASDRNGSHDVYTMPCEGGAATRLTCNSATELPIGFTPDGSKVLYSAYIQAPATSVQFPRASFTQVYSVPVQGGKSVQMLGTPALALSYSPDGSFFLYQDTKGMEDTWRKHHISSVTRDIWKYDVATGRHTNLTARPGEDLDPVLCGNTVYLLSEPSTGDAKPRPEGWQTSINVYSFALDKPSEMTQVSHFKTHPVRFLSMGGGKLCYTWNGEIYTQVPGSEPQKVAIDVVLDENNPVSKKTFSGNATEAAVSPDGKQIALIVRGEVFVTSVNYTTTKRITDTPSCETGVCFGKDSRTLIYASDRNGLSQLYEARIVRKEDPDFANATLIEEKPLLHKAGVDRREPKLSPDGKKLAFIEDRTRLMVADLSSGNVSQITDGSCWFSLGEPFAYDWSRDSKWLTLEYTPNAHDPYYNIGLVSVKGGEITDLTGSGYMNFNPKFTLDGNAITFESDRYGMRAHASWGSLQDVFMCFLNKEAMDRFNMSKEDIELSEADKKDKKDSLKVAKVELEGIEDRIVRLTQNSSNLGNEIVTKDGSKMYFTTTYEKRLDLWSMDLKTRETRLVSKGSSGAFASDASGKTLFLLGNSIAKIDGDKLKPVSYSAEFNLDPAAERESMFDFVEREEANRFYCTDMHGVDWKMYCDAYRRFLPHISNNYDFSEMLSELLGELNVSHTGSGYRATNTNGEPTGNLGLLFDLSYDGEGLKVAEIIEGGPCDKADIGCKAGNVITHINGTAVDGTDLSLLLKGTIGKKTLVSIKGRKDIVIVPVSNGTVNNLMYKRWVKQRAADVERLSGGRLGYVHIQSMNDASFRTIYNELMGKYYKCEGIVIDQRFNGGGRMHEDIEILFGGEKYLTQVVRGRESCDMPSRRWNKPSIMLQCECDYSNAHGTPWVYSHRKLGKLVGAPVPGTMTSVNWVDLQDPSLYFGIPVIGYRTAEGSYLENSQLEPDVLVYNRPEDIVKGEDAQLRAAVEELLKQIDQSKRQ